jgi:sugar/nucleoside kinase (ribokinase family)
MRPDVVLANEQEWEATQGRGDDPDGGTGGGLDGGPDGGPGDRGEVGGFGAGGTTVLVLKRGKNGCSFVIDGVEDHRDAVPGPVVDVTGAGDALAAGFLLGGPDLAMEIAARCVGQIGAQPHTLLPENS